MSNCYDFDGKLKKIFGQDKLFLDDLESTWLGSFNRAIKKFLVEKNITETDDFDLNQIHNHVDLEYHDASYQEFGMGATEIRLKK